MRPRTNKFPGRRECGIHVPAGAGQAVKTTAGKWAVRRTRHDGRNGLSPAAEDAARIARDGWIAYRDGERRVINRADWQACTSLTHGVADAYDRDEVREASAAAAVSDAEAAKRPSKRLTASSGPAAWGYSARIGRTHRGRATGRPAPPVLPPAERPR